MWKSWILGTLGFRVLFFKTYLKGSKRKGGLFWGPSIEREQGRPTMRKKEGEPIEGEELRRLWWSRRKRTKTKVKEGSKRVSKRGFRQALWGEESRRYRAFFKSDH